MDNLEPEIEEVKQKPLDDDLEYTRKLKYQILEHSFGEDGRLLDSEDPKKRDFILRVMDSMDKAAIGRKRIQVDEGANEIARETNGFLARLHTNELSDPLRSNTPVARNIVPDLGSDASSDMGEFQLSVQPEAGKTNYDDFNREFLDKNPEYGD